MRHELLAFWKFLWMRAVRAALGRLSVAIAGTSA
jgi:hypothetical protein